LVKRLAAISLAAALVLTAPAHAGAPTGRVLVLVRAQPGVHASAAAVRAVIARTGARPSGPQAPAIGLVTLRPAPGTTAAALIRRLRGDASVRSVQAEGRMTLRFMPNDPALGTPETHFPAPPGTTVQWTLQREGLPAMWDVTHGDGARVGLIDTGIDASHPELGSKFVAAVDQDDDPGAGPPTTDQVGHGTHVGSLACAATNNGIGLAGAGFDCGLIVEKTDLTDASIADSIVDATNRGAQAINMSFGDDGNRPPVQAIIAAIDYAYAHDVVLVAAASDKNSDQQGQPADLLQPTGSSPNIDQGKGLDVTAAAVDDTPSGAGHGTQVSLAAYGSLHRFDQQNQVEGLFGAFPANPTTLEQGQIGIPPTPGCGCRTTFAGDSRYAYLQGTSMAAPQVTAVAALIRNLNPALHAGEVVRLLKASARRPTGAWSDGLGWGILNAGAAVETARRVDRTPPASKVRAPRRSARRSFVVRWSGSDPAAPGLIPSGIRLFDVYVSVNGGRAHRIAHTARHSLRFRARPGKRYAFFSEAVDRAGNREARPSHADVTTRVSRSAR
jgi:serine protease